MIIKGAMVCDARGEQKGDVRIKEGKIAQVSRSILPQENEEIIEAENLVLLPGAMDLNVRVSNGILSKENLLKLSHKSIKGGITQALLMPDSKPTLSSELGLELLNAIREEFEAEIIGIAEAVKESKNALNALSLLYKKGAKGIFVKSNTDGNLLRRACEFAKMLDVPMFFSCEDEALSANGVMNDGELSSMLGLPAILTLSETKEVAQMAEMVLFMGVKGVFLTLATQRSVEIIQQLKSTFKQASNQKAQFHLQTSIHHLLLTEDLCSNYNTAAKIKPPLKSESTRKALVKSVKKGEITLITSLQSEQSLAQKDLSFEEAAFGVDMIAYFLPLCYTLFVKMEHLSLSELSQILSVNPANVLGLKHKGLIAEGYDADLVLFDTKALEVIDSIESPYYHWSIQGKVKRVFAGGKQVIVS